MDKPQLDEPTIHDELAAHLEQHAEFYPNARAKLTAEGFAELEEFVNREKRKVRSPLGGQISSPQPRSSIKRKGSVLDGVMASLATRPSDRRNGIPDNTASVST